MLYLNPPFPVIRGVALFPDHQDPLQWYFMPSAPRLSLIADPVAKPRPALQLIKFRGDAGDGGFLNFDVNLGIDESVLDDVKSELRSSQFKLPPGTIKLAPVPLTGGTVRLLILGQESPPPRPTGTPAPAGGAAGPTAPAAGGAPQFVLKISHDAHPSLYGDNQAAFSVALDRYGVTVLEDALAGNMAPIGVVYGLEYLGLRPAYSVHLSIDWDRVQEHMDTHFGVNTMFMSASIDDAVDELIESRAIVLEADTFVPEGEENDTTISNRDRALNECRDMITDAFFTPSIDPANPNPDDEKLRTAERVGKMIATGGMGGMFSYSKNTYKRIDKKKLDVNFSERTTVKRAIYPQGHLTGLFQVLRDQGLNMDDFVSAVDLNDPWFERRKLKVISLADFETDSIASLNVTLSYGSSPTNVILDKANPTREVSWLSLMKDGAMERAVTHQFKVRFKGVDRTERPLELDSAPDVTTVDNLEIEPRSLYAVVPIPVAVPNPLTFPWDRYPRVEVHCEYEDAANHIHDREIIFLEKEHADAVWKLFVRESEVQFRYKLIYRGADNRDHETDWRITDSREVMVRDPFPAKRTLTVVPPSNWTVLDQVFVDLTYEDHTADFTQEASFNFSENERLNKTFSVDLRNTAERRVGFGVTFLDKNGGMIEIPKSYTLEQRLILRSDMLGHRVIVVRAPKIDFQARKVRQLDVALTYEDAAASLQYAGQVTLKSPADQGTFEFGYVDAAKSRYQYRVSAQFLNGMTQDFDAETSDTDDLNLEL